MNARPLLLRCTALLLSIATIASAQEPPVAPPAASAEMPDFPGPAPEHALLERFVGSWKSTNECSMAPGAEPTTSQGSTHSRMLGDRWIINEVEIGAATEDAGDQPVHGVQVIGYDPTKGKYVGTWTDSMTNHLWVYEGEYDEASQTLKLDADGPSLTGDGATTRYRDEYRFVADDHIVARSLAQGEDGEWTVFMTGELRRAVK